MLIGFYMHTYINTHVCMQSFARNDHYTQHLHRTRCPGTLGRWERGVTVSGVPGGRQGLDGLPEESLHEEDSLPGEVQGVWWFITDALPGEVQGVW